MIKKLPAEAFSFYVRLGPSRSYRAVAQEFGVHKRTVLRAAQRESWAKRLEVIGREATERADAGLAGELKDLRLGLRQAVWELCGRAVEALQKHPPTSAKESVRVAEVLIGLERLLAERRGAL